MKKINQWPLGVFDSGMGGLTVARSLLALLPQEKIIYLGDTARYPYGSRSREAIIRFARQNTEFLLKQQIKMLVVACNTASAFALEALQAAFRSLPVIGVITPCVEAIARARIKGTVGVIGTEGTIQCGIYEKEIKQRQPGLKVVSQACPLFVPLVEEGLVQGPITQAVIDYYLRPMKNAGLEALVLACTHYPLLLEALQAYWAPQKVLMLDSAAATARTVQQALRDQNLERPAEKEIPAPVFYVTDARDRFQEWGSRFLGRPMEKVVKIDIF